MTVRISEVAASEINEVVGFVMAARALIFPMLDVALVPTDLGAFEQTYGEGKGGRFLVARQGALIVGVIGFLPYDGRFAQLELPDGKVVEIVRLFVSPECRGAGLATALYRRLKALAQEDQVETLYLHTHPFLPGAIRFWERFGFQVRDVEADPVWRTTHMEVALERP